MLTINGVGWIRGSIYLQARAKHEEVVPWVTMPVVIEITSGVQAILQAMQAGRLWDLGWTPEGNPALEWLDLRVKFPLPNCSARLAVTGGESVLLKNVTLHQMKVRLLKGRNLDLQAKLEWSGPTAQARPLFDLALAPSIQFEIRQKQDSGLLAVA